MNLAVRIILTALLVWWVLFPVFADSKNESILAEIYRIGMVPAMLIMGAFFGMVAFYCRTLKKCYLQIKPENRKAKPNAVWYMFALPFNFVEDFFIVIDLARSLEEEKKNNDKLSQITDFGMVSGIGWSIAQIMSFIPNLVGQVAGMIGFVLVIYHWILINRIKNLLSAPNETS